MELPEALRADATAIADDYRDAGRDVLELHPTTVAVDVEGQGFNVVVPDEEFDALDALRANAFDSTDVFLEEGETAISLIVVERSDDEDAVLYPVRYPTADASALIERARREGIVYTHVRPATGDRSIAFAHDDPSLFVP